MASMISSINDHDQMIVRRVRVDRSRTPQQVIDAINRIEYVDRDVVAMMPRGEGQEVDVYFFPLRRFTSDEEAESRLKNCGLVAADPYSLSAFNKADPAFADNHPNATHWKDTNGKWCHIAFDRWSIGRSVRVGRSARDWDGNWWLAGLLRKQS